ncbi:MAG: hypothetical protein O3C46_02290, partial [Bacteroidetes bacterium]|nr:hypothetical protein [Bacteroidota bacterium]
MNDIWQSNRCHRRAFRYRKSAGVSAVKLADTYNQLGRIAMKMANWNQAIVAYALAWQNYTTNKNNPGRVFILNNMATFLNQFNADSKAKLMYHYALKLVPDSHSVFAGDIHMNLGSSYLNSGELLHTKWHLSQS